MKVILYMALTVNGMIAKTDGNSDWVSEEDAISFGEVCRRAKAVIMGRHTYEVLAPNDLPLTEGIHVVLTHDESLKSDNPTIKFVNNNPQETLSLLEEKGYQEVCVIGGSQTVTQFMEEGLIDEIYFDIEPLIFGKGMQIFSEKDFSYQLQLLEIKKLNENTVQLHYMVNKTSKN